MTVSLSILRPRSQRPAKRSIPLKRMFDVARQRRALANMSIERLKDLGISHVEAETEATRPFWDLP